MLLYFTTSCLCVCLLCDQLDRLTWRTYYRVHVAIEFELITRDLTSCGFGTFAPSKRLVARRRKHLHQIDAPDLLTEFMHHIHAPDACTRYAVHQTVHQTAASIILVPI